MGISLKSVLKGTLFAIAVTFIIILILSLLTYFTQISETIITVGVYASVIIGVLAGTIAVSRAAEHKAFIHAMLVCILYSLILITLSFAVNGGITFNMHLLTILAGIFVAGFIGAIIGK